MIKLLLYTLAYGVVGTFILYAIHVFLLTFFGIDIDVAEWFYGY